MDCKTEGRRRIERPKLRRIDGILDDRNKPGVKNWWTVSRDSEAWKKVFIEEEPRTGLYSY
jgi:hypothetical protein